MQDGRLFHLLDNLSILVIQATMERASSHFGRWQEGEERKEACTQRKKWKVGAYDSQHSHSAAISSFLLYGTLIPVSWENKKPTKDWHTNESQSVVEKITKKCYYFREPVTNINKNVHTVKFQVINNNTTRLLDFWHPMAGTRGTNTKIQINILTHSSIRFNHYV